MGGYFNYYRLAYSTVALITLSGCLAWQFSIPVHYVGTFPTLKYILGIPVSVFGIILMAICIRKYFYKLSGIGHLFHPLAPPVLECGGVHKIVRHPLYLGTVLVLWSVFLFFPSLTNLLACIMITLYVVVGSYFEERKLVQIFGKEYKIYQQNIPMFVPGIGLFGINLIPIGRSPRVITADPCPNNPTPSYSPPEPPSKYRPHPALKKAPAGNSPNLPYSQNDNPGGADVSP
jgi:protein-S-isoprenylcysteine O-methyltransferase Ste14